MTNAEIRKIAGLSASLDAVVDLWNDAATEILCDLLYVYEIARHVVTEERAQVHSNYQIFLRDFPIDMDESIVIKTTFDRTVISGYTFRKEPNEKFTIHTYGADNNIPLALPYDEVFISYTAGYRVQDVVEVLSNTNLAEKTISVTLNGTTTTYTFKAAGATGNQINVGATLAETATNIAEKFGTSAVGAVVTMPLGYGLTLGTATIAQLDVTTRDLPGALKNILALIAAGGVAEKGKVGSVVSYTIGSKSVTFRNDAEATVVETALRTWIPGFKRAIIAAI